MAAKIYYGAPALAVSKTSGALMHRWTETSDSGAPLPYILNKKLHKFILNSEYLSSSKYFIHEHF
jgi:hypothetical protein